MPEFLGGRISKLVTRLGTPASGTVASKVDTLHDTRLTATRAAKLDNVLSDAVWTGAKAAFLDAPISSVGGLPPGLNALKGVPTANADILTVEGAAVIPAGQLLQQSSTTVGVVTTLLEVTGTAGVIEFASLFQLANASNRDASARLLIDGVVVWESAASFWQTTADLNKGAVLVGAASHVYDYVTFGRVPFTDSFKIDFKITEAGGGTFTLGSRLRYYYTG